jgi:hypothetical protein
MEEEEGPREAGKDAMSETVIVDEVKYDLFRRILAGIVSAGRHTSPIAAAHMLTGEAYNDLIQAGVIQTNLPPMNGVRVDLPVDPRPNRNECGVCGATRALDPSPFWRSKGDWLLCPTCTLFDATPEPSVAPSVQAPLSFSSSIRWAGATSQGNPFEVMAPREENNTGPVCLECGQYTKNAPAPEILVFCKVGEKPCPACYQLLPKPKEAFQIK